MSYANDSKAISQKVIGLLHYLGKGLRTEWYVIAINISLKTSNASEGRQTKCVLVSNTIAKRLADGCHCMLLPTVSSGSAFCLV